MAESKTCYGQAYIVDNQLIQDTITFETDGRVTNGTNVIVANIWEDLKTENSHLYQVSNNRYFYWEYTQTNDEGADIKIKYEAPQPNMTFFETNDIEVLRSNYDNGDYENSPYPKYWAEKFIAANDNYNERYSIQKKEIVFAETHSVNYSYDPKTQPEEDAYITTEKYSVKNNDLAFIENLISTIF